MSSLRTLTTVNEQYRTRFNTYAASLENLEDESYVDSLLGSGRKGGYVFTYTAGETTWSCAAEPAEPGTTRTRCFFADQTGVIRYSTTGTASAVSTPVD